MKITPEMMREKGIDEESIKILEKNFPDGVNTEEICDFVRRVTEAVDDIVKKLAVAIMPVIEAIAEEAGKAGLIDEDGNSK